VSQKLFGLVVTAEAATTLRPPDLARDGLCGALRKHVDVLQRLHGAQVTADTELTCYGDAEAGLGHPPRQVEGGPAGDVLRAVTTE
jgi:hypothetical protein